MRSQHDLQNGIRRTKTTPYGNHTPLKRLYQRDQLDLREVLKTGGIWRFDRHHERMDSQNAQQRKPNNARRVNSSHLVKRYREPEQLPQIEEFAHLKSELGKHYVAAIINFCFSRVVYYFSNEIEITKFQCEYLKYGYENIVFMHFGLCSRSAWLCRVFAPKPLRLPDVSFSGVRPRSGRFSSSRRCRHRPW